MLSKCIIDKTNNLAQRRVGRLAGLALACWLLSGPLIGAFLSRRASANNTGRGGGWNLASASLGPELGRQDRSLRDEVQDSGSAGRDQQEKLLSEAERLWKQGTAEARHRAIENYNEALSQSNARDDHGRDASILTSIGSIYMELGENQNALESFNRALAAVDSSRQSREKADLLSNIGLVQDRLGDKGGAIATYERALAIVRLIHDRGREGGTLNDVGLVHWSAGDLPRALNCFIESLSIRKEIGDRQGESTTLHNLGVINSSMAEFGKALQYYDQALLLERELGQRQEEARTLNNIGVAYAAIGEYQKALRAYEEALPIRREVVDRRGEAYTLANIGDLHAALGDYDEALSWYEQALPIDRQVGDRTAEVMTTHSLGLANAGIGEHRRALNFYQEAVTLARTAGVPRLEAQTLNSLGRAYGSIGDNDRALEYYGKALSLRRAVGDRGGQADSLSSIAAIYVAQGKSDQALDNYAQALSIERAIGHRAGEVATLAGMARAQASAGNLTGAIASMESALGLFELVRGGVASRELRASFLSSAAAYYEQYVDLLMRQHAVAPGSGCDALAMQASERGRARSLLESLGEASIDIKGGIDAALWARDRDIQRRLNEREAFRTRLLAGGQDKNQIASVDRELERLLVELHEVEAQIRADSPGYAALTRPTPLSVSEVQHQLLDADTVLLEYSLGRERSFLWAITASSVASFELPKRSEIDGAARRAYELLAEGNQRIHKRDSEVAMWELSRMALGPVAALLANKRLLIVPDGALHYVPFEALPEPDRSSSDSAPLIVNHEITYLPSASVLAELRRVTSGRRTQERTVAVLADPVFGENDPRVDRASHPAGAGVTRKSEPVGDRITQSEVLRSIGETGGNLERLPFARREAEAILRLPNRAGLAALDFKASRTTATSPELGHYRVVHFATHALINSKHPELSGIVLSLVDQQGRPQNGFLAAHDVYNLKLGADLVVLSGCRTALGKEIRGEGIVSIVRGFMYAGAPRVVASLWDVRDEAAAELMRRFYQGFLSEGLAPAAALRAAKVSMRKEKQWESPYYWAAFLLQGEWR